MKLQFNLAEIMHLALEGLDTMRMDQPDMPEWMDLAPHLIAIKEALAFAEPKCLADYTVTLDIMDTFEP